ncbi:hypothetical protein H1V43_09880 [Streptomyces sp. PSKA54]|uniref:Uncharacterized protein n=1 Tax=Streptomyces himalayensis subsp. aureolus TaxID=2758039 RepID=A0A7W2HF78_9ACTN|nr:hypothetical protein [Streptomyces himalayensis]MBA4861688.1 hypothetical protein [Streptomyces himalayensis subsp. aureolus]
MRIRTAAWGAAAAGAVVGTAAVLRNRGDHGAGAAGNGGTEHGRWHVITVGVPRDVLMPGGVLPPPLDHLSGGVEVRTADAPAGRGTEIAARALALPGTGQSLRRILGTSTEQRIRRALREFKQFTEAGEVLRVAGQPEGHHKPGGLLVAVGDRRSAKEGLL